MATFGTFVSGQILTAAELNAGLPTCVVSKNPFTATNGVSGVVAFDTELTDLYGWHSTSVNTSRITPNIAGTYLVTMLFSNVSAALVTRALANVFKNGASNTPLSIITDTTGTLDDFTTVGFVTANGTTDYFEMNYLVSGATITVAAAQFSMTRISS